MWLWWMRMRSCVLLLPLFFVFLFVGLGDAGTKGGNKGVSTSPSSVFRTLDLWNPKGEGEIMAKAGENIRLKCISPYFPVDTTRVTWYRDGKEIKNDNGRMTLKRIGLTINNVKQKDAGFYECRLVDPNDPETVAERNATLVVEKKRRKKKPKEEDKEEEEEEEEFYEDDEEENRKNMEVTCARYQNLTDINSVEHNHEPFVCFDLDAYDARMTRYIVKAAGTTLVLYCNAKGYPKPTVTWLREGTRFLDAGFTHKITNKSLKIEELTGSDEAVYTCIADNGHTKIKYETQVVVNAVWSSRPRLVFEKNQTVLVGSDLILNCDVEHEEDDPDAASSLQIQRVFENETVPAESRTENATLLADPHILFIENVTMEDAGWYTCVAYNTIGSANTSIYIDVVLEIPADALSENNESTWIAMAVPAIGIVLGVGLFGVCVGVAYKAKARRWREKIKEQTNKGWTKRVVIDKVPRRDNEDGGVIIPEVNIKNVVTNMINAPEYEIPVDEKWEFPRDKLSIGKFLGEGAFGEVCQATAYGLVESGVSATVAVKTLKNTHCDADMIDLISEMETMKALGKHPNIINLLGCCTAGGDLFVIMEFAEHGSLLEYLRTNRNNYSFEKLKAGMVEEGEPVKTVLVFKDLMSYAHQVARGMEYLAQKKYVHRDLAARNVLITADHVAKICDFGMTRSTFANDYYRKKTDGRVPIKWMAPETLIHRVYTTHSDVWSYGILLWEIVTLGASPYPTITDMNFLLEFIRSGQRMAQPSNCPNDLYHLMRECWWDVPNRRPIFSKIVEEIDRILLLSITSQFEYFEMEGDSPPQEIITPCSSPENSAPFFYLNIND